MGTSDSSRMTTSANSSHQVEAFPWKGLLVMLLSLLGLLEAAAIYEGAHPGALTVALFRKFLAAALDPDKIYRTLFVAVAICSLVLIGSRRFRIFVLRNKHEFLPAQCLTPLLTVLALLGITEFGLVQYFIDDPDHFAMIYIITGVMVAPAVFVLAQFGIESVPDNPGDGDLTIGVILPFLLVGSVLVGFAIVVFLKSVALVWGVLQPVVVSLAQWFGLHIRLAFGGLTALNNSAFNGLLNEPILICLSFTTVLILYFFVFRFTKFLLSPRGRAWIVRDKYVDLDRMEVGLRNIIKRSTDNTNKRPWRRIWLLGDGGQLTRRDVEKIIDDAVHAAEQERRVYVAETEAIRQDFIAVGTRELAEELYRLSNGEVRRLRR